MFPITGFLNIDGATPPMLVVVIDTEEEFDWSKGFSRSNVSVESMRDIERAQRLLDRFGIKPIYVVDYPVATQGDGYRALQAIYRSGRCEIGAHLHPWVTPPFSETINRKNSFGGNLSAELERQKIEATCGAIAATFGLRPTIYKAGRYGVGPNTAEILAEMGFEIDLSICSLMDFSSEGGPDFTMYTSRPFWFGRNRSLLELPMTNGFTGGLRKRGREVYSFLSRSSLRLLRGTAIAFRLRALNRVFLSPEGFELSELISLTKALFQDGLRIFTFSFHSPSLSPGNTPYVRTSKELTSFLGRCEAYFEFFLNDFKGQAISPFGLKERLLALSSEKATMEEI